MAGGGDDYRDAAAQLGWGREGGRGARRGQRARGGTAVAGAPIHTGRGADRRCAGRGSAAGAFHRAHGPRNIPRPFARHLRRNRSGWSPTSRACSGRKTPRFRTGHLREFLGRQRQGGDQAGHRSAAQHHRVVSARAVRAAPDTCLRERESVRPGPAGIGGQSLPGDDGHLLVLGHLRHGRPLDSLRRLERLGREVGRFEAWEVYHTGMGLEPYTLERLGAGMFGVDTFTTPKLEAPTLWRDLSARPAQRGWSWETWLHLYPTDYLRFEVLGRFGSDNYRADNATGDTPWNYFGGRPTIIFDVGWFKLRLGAEYQKRTATTQGITPACRGTRRIRCQPPAEGRGRIDPVRDQSGYVEFGVNAAIAHQDDTNAFAGRCRKTPPPRRASAGLPI